jgi:hypothetical protein
MTCQPCTVGWHFECEDTQPIKDVAGFVSCCCSTTILAPFNINSGTPSLSLGEYVRAQKDNEDIKDVTSTGRKRAAILFPLPDASSGGMICEWAGLKFAGGGVEPIIGCPGNKIANLKEKTDDLWPGHVHHGPDKSTLTNEPSNISRVCPQCHNRWHSLNDPYYGERPENGLPFLPLSGDVKPLDKETKASDAEIAWSEKYWATKTRQRKREGLLLRLPETS